MNSITVITLDYSMAFSDKKQFLDESRQGESLLTGRIEIKRMKKDLDLMSGSAMDPPCTVMIKNNWHTTSTAACCLCLAFTSC